MNLFRNIYSRAASLAATLIAITSDLLPSRARLASKPIAPEVVRHEVPFSLHHPQQPRFERNERPAKPRNLKTSERARQANVYGNQTYAGADFISYAEHDRRTRERLNSPSRVEDDGSYAGYLAAHGRLERSFAEQPALAEV